VPGMIDAPALMLQDETAVAAVVVAEDASSPILAWRKGDRPATLRKAFPPFELDHAAEAKVVGQVAHAPRHYADFGMGQAAQGWFMKMIEVSMSQQYQINRGEVLDPQPGAFDAFEEEQPIGEIGIDQNIEISELHKEGSMANPSDCYLASGKLGKGRLLVFPGATGQKSFPDHFAEKRARIEMLGWGQIFERAWERLASGLG